MITQYLKRVSIGNRKGIITSVKIPSNTPICEFTGLLLTYEQVCLMSDPSKALQVGPNLYRGLTGNVTDYIRHSCNPNCKIHVVGNRSVLYSIYVIKANSEITFDYSTSSTEGEDTWKMNCTCGSYNCRKVISGFYTLSTELQEKYKQNGNVALFIKENIFIER
jgi:uncharacterized protein